MTAGHVRATAGAAGALAGAIALLVAGCTVAGGDGGQRAGRTQGPALPAGLTPACRPGVAPVPAALAHSGRDGAHAILEPVVALAG